VTFAIANSAGDRILQDTDVVLHAHEGRRAKPWFGPLLWWEASSSGWSHFNGSIYIHM